MKFQCFHVILKIVRDQHVSLELEDYLAAGMHFFWHCSDTEAAAAEVLETFPNQRTTFFHVGAIFLLVTLLLF